MKVIQFVPTLESGGVEQGVLEISKALVDAGHKSHVVSAGGRLVDQLINEGTYHHHWHLHKKNIFTLRQVKPLARWIEEMKADILHVRSRMPAWMVWKALNKIPEIESKKVLCIGDSVEHDIRGGFYANCSSALVKTGIGATKKNTDLMNSNNLSEIPNFIIPAFSF